MERNAVSADFSIGRALPEFSLLGVDNKNIAAREFFKGAKAALVIFTCNHCPYVKGSEKILDKLVLELMPAGLRVLAINSNDAAQYPEDSFEKMQEKSLQVKLPYPYLYDESQEVARLFDAACTPECYLFDKDLRLCFHGTINDSPRDPSKATQSYLAQAIKQVLAGEKPDPEFVHPMGCSIKWKA